MEQQILEAYKQTLDAGIVAIAIILAITGLFVVGLFWRFMGMWKNRSTDQSDLVQAIVTTSQAAKNTADHNARMLEEIRMMRESQTALSDVLIEVDTNVKGLQEQGVRADKNIKLTLDDLQRFQKADVARLDSILSAMERHETDALNRHKTLLSDGESNHKVILEDLDAFDIMLKGVNDKVNDIRKELSSIEAAQRKIVKYVQPVDTDELTDTQEPAA